MSAEAPFARGIITLTPAAPHSHVAILARQIELYGAAGRGSIQATLVRLPVLIDGGAENDLIRGGRGDDTLIGGAGHDLIWGGWGADVLLGSDGNNRHWHLPS